jgi:hypothetical protein
VSDARRRVQHLLGIEPLPSDPHETYERHAEREEGPTPERCDERPGSASRITPPPVPSHRGTCDDWRENQTRATHWACLEDPQRPDEARNDAREAAQQYDANTGNHGMCPTPLLEGVANRAEAEFDQHLTSELQEHFPKCR